MMPHRFDNDFGNGSDRTNGRRGRALMGIGSPGISARMQQLAGKLDVPSSPRRRARAGRDAGPVRGFAPMEA